MRDASRVRLAAELTALLCGAMHPELAARTARDIAQGVDELFAARLPEAIDSVERSLLGARAVAARKGLPMPDVSTCLRSVGRVFDVLVRCDRSVARAA